MPSTNGGKSSQLAAEVAQPTDSPTAGAQASRGWQQRLHDFLSRFGLVLSFGLLVFVLTLLSDRFLTVSNTVNILRQAAINGIISVGMTYVILTAGIDLSVGAVLALANVIVADFLVQGGHPGLAILLGLAIGSGFGLVNGLFTTRFGVPPFIVTLGTMTIARGLALTYTQGQPITGLPEGFRFMGTGSLGPLPMPIVLMILTFAVGYFVLNRTTLGAYIYALGNNPTAARFAGIPVNRYTSLVYIISGGLSALAGMILIARLNSAQPTAGLGYEFDAIAAVVVGGTSLAGGQGGLGGTLLGVLIIQVLNNGLNLLNVSSFYQQVVQGVVIALALLWHRAFR
ncbi:MAG: ABC transporter permease [Chloroflexi bacterium]|nr:ABC transporter permease [Chloroflexota bacterium]